MTTTRLPRTKECDETCLGFFVCCNDNETYHVERCDVCKRFLTDFDAGASLQVTLDRLTELREVLL